MLIIAFHKVELAVWLYSPAWMLYKCFICSRELSLQDGGYETMVPSRAIREASSTNTETSPCFRVTEEKAAGRDLLGPENRGLTAQPFDQNLLKSVAKSFSPLSPVSINEQSWHFTEKIWLVFPLTAGLDNEVKMTLSLIKVICRNHW